ncbi:unnamed protein product [Acanthoscelides obtectus]|uniref:Uncharacterized protein n=1 Tax=Acanthoscelides obtectus TaxID=200917 RepID=A0A9P0K4C1_ACAOB|nr:unnamed protein product [Acanthoscelides obtectus]CAK1654188.1 hypothetical protein AOBTE_LOCUS18472 [Acanthoscelides obtectus]
MSSNMFGIDIIFGDSWVNVVGSLVLITAVFTTVLVCAVGYMYKMLHKIQRSLDEMTHTTMDPSRRRTSPFARPHNFNTGYETEIPRVGGSSLYERTKLGQFDTGSSMGRERDDPYNVPRALGPRDRDNDSRGGRPHNFNTGYETEIPRVGGSSLYERTKLGQFDTGSSMGRERDDPYNVPRALGPRDRDNDSRGGYLHKAHDQNQYNRRN